MYLYEAGQLSSPSYTAQGTAQWQYRERPLTRWPLSLLLIDLSPLIDSPACGVLVGERKPLRLGVYHSSTQTATVCFAPVTISGFFLNFETVLSSLLFFTSSPPTISSCRTVEPKSLSLLNLSNFLWFSAGIWRTLFHSETLLSDGKLLKAQTSKLQLKSSIMLCTEKEQLTIILTTTEARLSHPFISSAAH